MIQQPDTRIAAEIALDRFADGYGYTRLPAWGWRKRALRELQDFEQNLVEVLADVRDVISRIQKGE